MDDKRAERIRKLKDKKETLEKRLQQEYGRERSRQRKLDTRRKILAGAAVLSEAADRPEFNATLIKLLSRFLTKPEDRALFNLPTQVSDRPRPPSPALPDEVPDLPVTEFNEASHQVAL